MSAASDHTALYIGVAGLAAAWFFRDDLKTFWESKTASTSSPLTDATAAANAASVAGATAAQQAAAAQAAANNAATAQVNTANAAAAQAQTVAQQAAAAIALAAQQAQALAAAQAAAVSAAATIAAHPNPTPPGAITPLQQNGNNCLIASGYSTSPGVTSAWGQALTLEQTMAIFRNCGLA